MPEPQIPVIDHLGKKTGYVTIKTAYRELLDFIEYEGLGQPAPTGSKERMIGYLDVITDLAQLMSDDGLPFNAQVGATTYWYEIDVPGRGPHSITTNYDAHPDTLQVNVAGKWISGARRVSPPLFPAKIISGADT